MNPTPTLARKITYLVIIIGLLIGISLLGEPSTSKTPGGKLAQLRKKHGLAAADIGQIDPTSATMKFATLGMDGIATTILWNRANEYKKRGDWDNMKATLNQIIKLQPHFVEIWKYQAWNLTYNVSVEFDDYRQRYHWVKKGIEFLIQGTEYNAHEPRLVTDLGVSFGRKIGKADERVQYRRLLAVDDDFHESLSSYVDIYEARRKWGDLRVDNWLLGHLWYLEAEKMVDIDGVTNIGKEPVLFYSDSAMSLVYYADAPRSEGEFNKGVTEDWRTAAKAWTRLANRELEARTYKIDIRLGDYKATKAKVSKLNAELEEMKSALKKEIKQSKLAKLTKEERKALDASPEERSKSKKLQMLVAEAIKKIEVTKNEIDERLKKKSDATNKIAELYDTEEKMKVVRRQLELVNYDYWETRCAVESMDELRQAHELIFNAEKDNRLAKFDEARKGYEAAWVQLDKVIKENPSLMPFKADDEIKRDNNVLQELEDIYANIKDYRRLLREQLDEEDIPQPFILQNVLDVFEGARKKDQGSKPADNKNPTGDPSPKDTPTDGKPADDKAPANETTPEDEPTTDDSKQGKSVEQKEPADKSPPVDETGESETSDQKKADVPPTSDGESTADNAAESL